MLYFIARVRRAGHQGEGRSGRCTGTSACRSGFETRSLSLERTLVCGTSLTARDVGLDLRKLLEKTRTVFQPADDHNHHQVACAELAVEPISFAQSAGQFAQALPDSIYKQWQTLAVPWLVALQHHEFLALAAAARPC